MAVNVLQPEADWNAGSFDTTEFSKTALESPKALASVFDHTLIRREATRNEVLKACQEAAAFRFACVMVNPVWVSLAYSVVAGSGVPVGATVDFPLGSGLTAVKREEALAVVKLGARELDMVLNLGLLRSGMNAMVEQDVRGVVEVAHEAGAIVKVILETSLLSVEEKLRAAELAITGGADFLKTSTGFSSGGATAADVALLRGVAGSRCGIKASGGIRTLADARVMLEAGANRLGSSSSVAIVREWTRPA
jgi:deoxyribose-phosphate aldolase